MPQKVLILEVAPMTPNGQFGSFSVFFMVKNHLRYIFFAYVQTVALIHKVGPNSDSLSRKHWSWRNPRRIINLKVTSGHQRPVCTKHSLRFANQLNSGFANRLNSNYNQLNSTILALNCTQAAVTFKFHLMLFIYTPRIVTGCIMPYDIQATTQTTRVWFIGVQQTERSTRQHPSAVNLLNWHNS